MARIRSVSMAQANHQRPRDSTHILSIVTVKRDMLLAQEALRVEGAALDIALEEATAADAGTVEAIVRLHARSQQAFARMRDHYGNRLTSGYPEILQRSADYNRLMPRILAAARLPRAARPPGLIVERIRDANELLAAMNRKSNSLSRSISSSDPLVN